MPKHTKAERTKAQKGKKSIPRQFTEVAKKAAKKVAKKKKK